MKLSKLILAMAASSMTVAPAVAASNNPAVSLSLAKSVRAGSATTGDSKLAGGAGGIFAALIAAGVAAIVIIAAVQNDSSDDSDSN